MLSREQILAAKAVKVESVATPEWGGDVFVRVMSGTARDEWEGRMLDLREAKTSTNVRAFLAVKTLCAADGGLLFSDADIEEVGLLDGIALSRVFNAAYKLNALGKEEVKAAEKNS